MSGGVDEIELVDLAADGFERQGHALRFDGNPALAFQIHGIEHLRLHFAGIQAAALLNESVSQGRLAVIDMSNDREIANILHLGPV